MDIATKWVYQQVRSRGVTLEAGQKPALCFRGRKFMFAVAAGHPVRVLKRPVADFDRARFVMHNGEEYSIGAAIKSLREVASRNGITAAAEQLLQRAEDVRAGDLDEDTIDDEEDVAMEKSGEKVAEATAEAGATSAPSEGQEDKVATAKRKRTKKVAGGSEPAAAKKTARAKTSNGANGAHPQLREGSNAQKAYAFWCKELAEYKKLEDVPRGELRKIGEKISSKFGIKSGVNYSYFFAKTYGLPKSA